LQGSWDPTGRFFVTAALGVHLSSTRYETGYRIYTFQGREVMRKAIETLLQFKWRPRPPVALPAETLKAIKGKMKVLSAKFDEEDRREQLSVSKASLSAFLPVAAADINVGL